MADIDKHISETSSFNYYRLTKEIHRSSDPEDEAKCNALNKKLGREYNSFKEFCMQLAGMLKNYRDISLSLSDKSIKCITLNMWMHEKIYDMLKTKEEYYPGKIINEIRDIWTYYTESTNCDIREELSNKYDFLDNKELFDYTINYENIKLHLADKGHKCTKEFKNYIKGIQKIYERQKGKHVSQGDHVYCDILDHFEKVNTPEKLAAVTCTEVQDRANNLVEESGAETSRYPEEPGTPGQTGLYGLQWQRGLRWGMNSQDFQGPSPILPQAEGTSPTKSVTAGISLAGIPVFSYLLYKVNTDCL
ncbi:variable surface protein Vir27 [Plasmodium vivax India VII]|uniref:Variable surface protein Vir27 n=2 Tax=Plasmodium vivax TaxID=5855 RepID=A0A0J9TF34_PLAVI|nr:variable surface protein Vir27 [Plasmodium vivax India VII]KMZ93706.1 variable surface protein Vir27 [Plasmodium vivax Mauritania I]